MSKRTWTSSRITAPSPAVTAGVRSIPTPGSLRWILVAALAFFQTDALAGVREQAKQMHDRLTGVLPSEAVLLDMASDLEAGDYVSAARTAMDGLDHDPLTIDTEGNRAFYSVTLKNWVTPWTNRNQDTFAALNDYTATVIGTVRDELDYRRILYDDILYTAKSGQVSSSYSNSSNAHYEELETEGLPLASALVDAPLRQSDVTGLPAAATAGVMTTRAAAKSFFLAGTNRAMFRFTLLNHLCLDLEQVKDTSRSPDRIRQDVSRSPGGDSRIFNNNCLGCHSGMDPLVQAYAYYDYAFDVDNDPEGINGSISYNDTGDIDPSTGTRVKAKYHINSANFAYGYITPDDHWDNYWRAGLNAALGWDSGLAGSGDGAKSMGQELAHSEAFAQCQVEKVFRAVCLRQPGDADDRNYVTATTTSFRGAYNYNLKRVFAETANYCKGS